MRCSDPRGALSPSLADRSRPFPSLTAGGVVAFALFSPYIQHRFRLDQAGTNAVCVGGLLGTYLSAGPVGLFADRYGSRWTSLLGAALNGAGYVAFGQLLKSDRHASPGGLPIQYALAVAYVCASLPRLAAAAAAHLA